MPYLTPDNQAGYHSRLLSVPVHMLHLVRGALETLTRPWNYEEFGDMSIDECVTAAMLIIADYDESDMIGAIFPVATDAIPENSLLCDGASYNRVDYPILYSRLDPAFVIDADTFTTPNLEARFVVGTGGSIETGDTGGSDAITLTTDNLPTHSHDYDKTVVAASTVLGALTGFELGDYTTTPTSDTGGGQPFDPRPPFLALVYVIIAG